MTGMNAVLLNGEKQAAEGDWQQNQLLVSGSYIDKYESTAYSMWL